MSGDASVHFEESKNQLRAVRIVRSGRSPLIAKAHAALFALGIVVSSYRVRAEGSTVSERLVLESEHGGAIEEQLSQATKSAILELAGVRAPDSK
jgi:UTP:GlnB (protein PII) uridylyltransferase